MVPSRNAAVWLSAFTFLGACAPASEADVGAAEANLRSCDRPIPLIFDTDMDFDDAAALAVLCQEHAQGRIELLAVTVENDGAGLPGNAIRHARCVLDACGLTDVPVADGSPVGVNATSPELLFVVDSVLEGAFAGCTASTAPASETAAELLVRTVRASRERVVLLTTGPLSNVSAALDLPRPRRGRPFEQGIERVVVMGGAFDVAGNLLGTGTETFDNSQELNIWIDPPAATHVFESFANHIAIVPLDATQDVPVTAAFAARLQADATTPEAQVVLSILAQPIVQFGMSIGAFYWWDPLAAVVATGHGDIVDFERGRVSVVQTGVSSGRTIEQRRGSHADIGVGADQDAFEDTFIDALNGR